MYESFYGFREKPFHVTADPSFLYPSQEHQEAMAHLTYGIQQRVGFLMITGEVGTGKTTLCKALLDKLPGETKTALVLNPALSPTELLQTIASDFGILPGKTGTTTGRGRVSRGELIALIEQFLLKQAATGKSAVVIIDEAQALSPSALEQVRLLSTVETVKSKLLQIVLIGQPELAEKLDTDRSLRALNDRISIRYNIQPLSAEEVGAYIRHRLCVAEGKRPPTFTTEAIAEIARISSGVPRRINRLCDQALLAGFVQESLIIDEKLMEKALNKPSENTRGFEENGVENSLQGEFS